MLSNQEQLRYSRQLLLKDFSAEQQGQLKNATVLVIGIGGLGNPVALYLAAAGIGKLILADGDKVELSNLQRQIGFNEDMLEQNKADTMAQCLEKLNSDIDIEVIDEMLDEELLDYYSQQVDVIVDCTDNLATRFLINDACLKAKVPLISGAAIRLEGQLFCFDPNQKDSACYACFYPKNKEEPTLNCNTAGVLGPILGVVGSMQALETIKYLVGKPMLNNKVMLFDGMTASWQQFKIKKRTACHCGEGD